MFKFLKIKGDSMYPLLKNGDIIFCLSRVFFNLKKKDIVIFRHNRSLMVKKITDIRSNNFYVKGESLDSIDSSIFGYINKKDILYKMIYKFK